MTSKLKKFLKILGIIIAVLAIVFILFLVWVRIQINRGNLVKWDGQWYTKEQLKEKFPPQYIEVEAKNTPEEVYAKFRQALLDNDIETALEQIREEKRKEYREAFKDREKLEEWVGTLPEYIENLRISGNFGYYDWDKGDGYKHTIDFLKELDKNDEVDVFFLGVRHIYKVVDKLIVDPSQVQYLTIPVPYEQLSLQTCWPPGTTWQRLMVFAEPK